MNCSDARELIHAYADGELDLVRNLEMEQHLNGCPECALVSRNVQTLKTAMGGGVLYHHAPQPLRKRVLAALTEDAGPVTRPEPWWRNWRLASAFGAACLALLATGAYVATRPTANDRLLDELAAGHVRSLMANHLTDVVSADKHRVQAWFDGKLDFGPQVPDLSLSGYPLVGGRMDYFNDRPAAALVYRRRDHYINVFMWRLSCEDTVPDKTATRQPLQVAEWNQGGLGYGAVSDLSEGEMKAFVDGLKKTQVPGM